MDGLDLWTIVPGAGIAGALVVVIGLLLRANFQDRAQYVELQTKSGEDYEKDISNLRKRIRELEDLLDTCRDKRHLAEDELYEARRTILRLERELEVIQNG